MDVQLLGTAAAEGCPAMFCHCEACRRMEELGGKNIRARSNAMINGHILVDFSPDMFWNRSRFHLDLGGVTDMFLTHPHIDHVAAAELALRSEGDYCMGLEGRRLRIHCSAESETLIRGMIRYDQGSGGEKYLEYCRLVPFEPVTVDGVTITPLPANHAREGFACYVFLLEQEGKVFLYGNDAASFPENTWEFLLKRFVDAAILDCTFGTLPLDADATHMNMEAASAVWQRLLKGGAADAHSRCWLTHFSHDCGMTHDELERAAAPYGLRVAYDGLTIHI